MHDICRKQSAAVEYGGETEQAGSINFGPIRKMRLDALMDLMRAHRITTGYDIGIHLIPCGQDRMMASVTGVDVPGYFLELDGFGIEAVEEDLHDFVIAVTHPGDIVNFQGSKVIDLTTAVRTVATSRHDGRTLTGQIVRKLDKAGTETILMQTGDLIAIEGSRPERTFGPRPYIRLAAVS